MRVAIGLATVKRVLRYIFPVVDICSIYSALLASLSHVETPEPKEPDLAITVHPRTMMRKDKTPNKVAHKKAIVTYALLADLATAQTSVVIPVSRLARAADSTHDPRLPPSYNCSE